MATIIFELMLCTFSQINCECKRCKWREVLGLQNVLSLNISSDDSDPSLRFGISEKGYARDEESPHLHQPISPLPVLAQMLHHPLSICERNFRIGF